MGRRPRPAARPRPALDTPAPDAHRGPVADRRPRDRRRAGRALPGDRPDDDPVDRLPHAGRPRGARAAPPQPRRRRPRGVPRPAGRRSTATCTASAAARPGRSARTRRPRSSRRSNGRATSRWTSATSRSPGRCAGCLRRDCAHDGDVDAPAACPTASIVARAGPGIGLGLPAPASRRAVAGAAAGRRRRRGRLPTRPAGSGSSRRPARRSTTSRRTTSGWTALRPSRARLGLRVEGRRASTTRYAAGGRDDRERRLVLPGPEARLRGHRATTSRSTPGRSTRHGSATSGRRRNPGGFYGGWVTSRIVGPIKGEPGSAGW